MSVAAAVAESSEMAGGGLVAAAGEDLAAHQADQANPPALLQREDCTLVAWYPCVYAPRAGGAYDSHHRTAGITGRTRRHGGRVAARGARAAGGDAGDRVSYRLDIPAMACGHQTGPERNRVRRGPQHSDRISVGRR